MPGVASLGALHRAVADFKLTELDVVYEAAALVAGFPAWLPWEVNPDRGSD
jgi:hypothetical protein